MIESIEGKRGLPRHRPPYVAQVGLFGRPTLEQNVETLFWVRDIVEKGAQWMTAQGRHVLSDQDDMKAVALNLMKFFEDEGRRPAEGALGHHARCLDLRPRPGGAQPAAVRAKIFPRGTYETAGHLVNHG
jgi:hypothetical protein